MVVEKRRFKKNQTKFREVFYFSILPPFFTTLKRLYNVIITEVTTLLLCTIAQGYSALNFTFKTSLPIVVRVKQNC